MYVRVEAEVRPTEDLEKVLTAVKNIFNGRITVENKGNGYFLVKGESYSVESLLKLHELLRMYRILDAARKNLVKGTKENTIIFMLHKQAAFVKRISFVDSERESPLGAIVFTIETSDPDKLIDWLAPKTSMGKPLWEIDMPED